MRIAVINFSGNVGKTLISKYLLSPRMHAKHFCIETINHSENVGYDVVRYKAKDYQSLQQELLSHENIIFDVGSSNVEDFTSIMKSHEGFESEFDYFIIPVVSDKKQQVDTINTIEMLSGLNIEPHRIKLIFNKVEMNESSKEDITRAFSSIVGFYQVTHKFELSFDYVLYHNDAYQLLHDLNISIDDILNDETDFRTLYRNTEDSTKKTEVMNKLIAKRLSITVKKNLDQLFNHLFSVHAHG